MTTPSRSERLRQAVARAAEAARARDAPRTGPPAPGDLYVFRTESEASLEWLVLRAHPDDPFLLLVVPVDDGPLAGTPDVPLPPEEVGRPLTARCGQGLWAPALHFAPALRVGSVPAEALRRARSAVADLARGEFGSAEERRRVDLDPEYESWMAVIEQAREEVRGLVNRPVPVLAFADLAPGPPPELAAEPQLALAAEAGELLAGLEEALTEAAEATRYFEVPWPGPGRLTLLADDQGVRGVWVGETADAPALGGQGSPGPPQPASWQAGPEGRLHVSRPAFPWLAGQVVLTIGADPPRTLTIRR